MAAEAADSHHAILSTSKEAALQNASLQNNPQKQRRNSKQQPLAPDTQGPIIRRMSRLEPRNSIQHGQSSRRMSYASRSSISGLSWGMANLKTVARMANTYRLAPRAEEKFSAAAAQRIMTGVLQSYLEGERYDKNLSLSLSKNLAEVIKERMKDQGFSARYKYVCVVTLGEKRDQGMAVCSRCIWNTETDNYASSSYTKGDLFAVATLYALYFE